MALTARDENIKTLSAALGIEDDEAAELLKIAVHITFDESAPVAAKLAHHIHVLMSRTIDSVMVNQPGLKLDDICVELVIGNVEPLYRVTTVFVGWGNERIVIARDRPRLEFGPVHGAGLLLASCYAVAAVLQAAFRNALPFPDPGVYDINISELYGGDVSLFSNQVDFGEAYLAGAGAVGNAFVYALSEFDVKGILNIVDPDVVSAGNLQRCVLFEDEQIETVKKADALCAAIDERLPDVAGIPHVKRLDEVSARDPNRGWLNRLIVAVDSPRARRRLQAEIPGEVFDASTTGIAEVALHFNCQPTERACLACAYHHSPDEDSHDRHVAELLGVALDDVRENFISEESARTILKRYPGLEQTDVVGIAYDTLYKQLCAKGHLLKGPEDQQVLAPFAFVSMLAGTLLAIEFILRIQRGQDQTFNEWRVSAWWPPILRCQQLLNRRSDCEFCGSATLRKVTKGLWQVENATDAFDRRLILAPTDLEAKDGTKLPLAK